VLGMDHLIAGAMPQIVEHASEAARLLGALGDPLEQASALVPLAAAGGSYMFAAEIPANPDAANFVAAGEEAVRLAVDANWKAGESLTRATLASALGMRGRYDGAWRNMLRALRIAEDIGHTQWVTLAQIQMGEILLDLLSHERAIEALEPAVDHSRRTNSVLHLRFATSALARALAAAGEVDRALALMASRVPAVEEARVGSERTLWRAYAEVLLARGNAAEALAVVERLIATSANASANRSAPLLEWLRARAAGEAGQVGTGVEAAGRALALTERAGFEPVIWRALSVRAALLRRDRQIAASREAAIRAESVVQRLADRVPDAAVAEAFRGRALAGLETQSAENALGLTDREREVLRLVADGATNAAIGERLFIAPRTVKSHLESIYNKLGVDSRTAAATKARDHGAI
jgi:DNA-binding CsgD family transcriptional regulator